MKICPVGAEMSHADGRTDMTKLKIAFRNFANAPKTSKRPIQEEPSWRAKIDRHHTETLLSRVLTWVWNCTAKLKTQSVSQILAEFNILTWLSARESFTEFCRP